MEFTTRPPTRDSETLVPLINIVFLLLIFFLLVGSVRAGDRAEIALPSQSSAGAQAPASATSFVLPASGQLEREGVPVSASELASGAYGDVVLRADARAEARHLLPVLAALAEARAASVSLVTLETASP
ncbi:MAG: biopolymer transporter ExbD [Proteobacteria bacterium]|nr:biopolymer transporter ExbD [Pseudomonadota bacterium]